MRASLIREARAVIGAPIFAASGGRDGSGVVLAVIDTGFDVRHAALRGRVRWVLDQSAGPRGTHPESERRFRGAVWSGEELEREITERPSSESITTDPSGHGTFVASIAAGGGGESREGVAPAAELVLVKVGSVAGIADESIVEAMDFALDRAGTRPLVVVLAAGSADGTHDGVSALERAIDQRFSEQSAQATSARRALVVAAGNEGGSRARRRFRVSRAEGPAEIGVFVSAGRGETRSFSIVHEGAVELAIEGPSNAGSRAARTRWVALGEHVGAGFRGFTVGIDRSSGAGPASALAESLREGTSARSALVTVARSDRDEAIDRGSAWRLLARGDAVLDVYGASGGVAIEGGVDEGTLVVPATAASAIVVGAQVTREQWPAPDGAVRVRTVPRSSDGVAEFSSRGPDRVHRARPDLVAPGAWVLGARSAQCDSRAPGSLCADSEATSDPHTIAAIGTSVAAPIAAGAIARLWSTDPSLSRAMVLSRLTRSSERWTRSLGWGPVDLRAALATVEGPASRCTLAPATDEVAPGEPLSFALRASNDRGAIDRSPVIDARATGGVLRWIHAFEGGRAELRVRVSEAATERVSLRATLDNGVACEASALVRPNGRGRPASCRVECVGAKSTSLSWAALVAIAFAASARQRWRSARVRQR